MRSCIIYVIILFMLVSSISPQMIRLVSGDTPASHSYQLYMYKVVVNNEYVAILYNVSFDNTGCIVSTTTTINNITTHLDTYGYRFIVKLVKILDYKGDLTNLLYHRGAGKYIVKNYIVCRQNLSLIPRTARELLRFPYYLNSPITSGNNTIILNGEEWHIIAIYDHDGWLKHLEANSTNTTITIDQWRNIRGEKIDWNPWIILATAITVPIAITAYVFLRRK